MSKEALTEESLNKKMNKGKSQEEKLKEIDLLIEKKEGKLNKKFEEKTSKGKNPKGLEKKREALKNVKNFVEKVKDRRAEQASGLGR